MATPFVLVFAVSLPLDVTVNPLTTLAARPTHNGPICSYERAMSPDRGQRKQSALCTGARLAPF
jgi:hypothetical protein